MGGFGFLQLEVCAVLIFVSLAFAGFLMVAGSFLLGGDDHDHDHDVDHDHGGGEEGNEHSISIFSTKVLFTFVMGFGAAGAIGTYFGLNIFLASLAGVGSGGALGVLMYLLMNFFMHQQANSVTTAEDFVGLFGTITVAIDRDQAGEVGLQTSSGYHNFLARSPLPISKGRRVKVTDANGNTLMVEEVVA